MSKPTPILAAIYVAQHLKRTEVATKASQYRDTICGFVGHVMGEPRTVFRPTMSQS